MLEMVVYPIYQEYITTISLRIEIYSVYMPIPKTHHQKQGRRSVTIIILLPVCATIDFIPSISIHFSDDVAKKHLCVH